MVEAAGVLEDEGVMAVGCPLDYPEMVRRVIVKRQFFSMSRIFDKKRSKPKIFLAYNLNQLCLSFIL